MSVFLTLLFLITKEKFDKAESLVFLLCASLTKIVFWVLVWSIKTLPRTQATILSLWVIKVKIYSRQFDLLISFLFIYLCVWICACVTSCMWRPQDNLWISLSTMWGWSWNTGHQACLQLHLYTESSCWPTYTVFVMLKEYCSLLPWGS